MVAPPPLHDLDEPAQPLSIPRKIFRAFIGVLVLASFGVWAYAYSGQADRPHPDELDSTSGFIEATDTGEPFDEVDGLPAYGKRAEVLCEATISELPDARDAESPAARAQQILDGNAALQSMVDELRTIPVATGRDDELRNLWLDDWEVLLGDRARYAADVAVDGDAQLTISDIGGEERLERRITRFARTNLMLPCGAPSDLG